MDQDDVDEEKRMPKFRYAFELNKKMSNVQKSRCYLFGYDDHPSYKDPSWVEVEAKTYTEAALKMPKEALELVKRDVGKLDGSDDPVRDYIADNAMCGFDWWIFGEDEWDAMVEDEDMMIEDEGE